MVEDVKIDLQYPIATSRGDGEILSITLRRLTAKDLRSVPEEVFSGKSKNPAMFLPVIASQTGISEEDLEKMDAADFLEVAGALSDFLVRSRRTGGT